MLGRIAGPRLVREWRQRQTPRVTQAELGRRVGCDGSAIRHYEGRRQPLSLAICVALAHQTEIALEALLPPDSLRLLRTAARLLGRGAGVA